MTGKEIREEVDNYLIKTREERKNAGLAKVPEFDERDIKQAYRDGLQSGLWHHSYDYLVKTADLKKRYEKQKEINEDLDDELQQSNECHDCAKLDEMPKGPRCKTCDNGSHFQKKEIKK